MVCKNDVIAWFKNLKSYKRVDVMSSLLQLCVPFELRFLGTCLEDLAKRDFQELRQTETEANSLAELNSPDTQSLANKDGRIKLALYVSLLQSCNEACANRIFKILTKDDVNSVLKLALTDDNVLEELLSIYTIAVNHPAFSFDQKLELDKIFIKLQEEENRIIDQNIYKNKQNFPVPNIQDAMLEKPPPAPIQSYQPCIGPDEQFQPCYVTSPMGPPHVPPQPHPPAALLTPKTFIYGEPFVSDERRMGLVGWPGAVAVPVGSDGSPGSRASSPCQSPSPPPGTAIRRSPPRQRQHPVRDTITKEMPTYSNRLHEYSPDQLKSMNDDELKEMGLPPKAIGQLKAILSAKPIVPLPTANGVPHPPVHVIPQPPPTMDPRKKPPEIMMRGAEMAVPAGVACVCWGAARPPRGESSSDSASDHSPPDTPDPRHAPPPQPLRQHPPRPHPQPHHSMVFRRRDGVANGVPDERKIYPGNGGVEPPASYFSPQGWCQPYPLRAAPYAPFPFPVPPRPPPPSYPFPNGEVVYSTYYPYAAHPPIPAAKLSCYNCGSPTHAPPDCPESTMEEITKQGQYRIDYNKQQQIAAAPVQQPQPTPPDPSNSDK